MSGICMVYAMAIPFMEFQDGGNQISKVLSFNLSKGEFVQRKLQYLLKRNDGMVLKMPNFDL